MRPSLRKNFMRAHKLEMVLLLAAATHAGAPAQAEAQVELSAGAFFATGDFDGPDADADADADVAVAPFSLRVSRGPWSVRATLPYVSLRGPSDLTIVVDDDSGGRGGSNSSSDRGARRSRAASNRPGNDAENNGATSPPRSTSGLGDASLSGTYSLDQLGSTSASFDLTARVRLPTGDEDRGLGVGTTDYAVIGELGWGNDTVAAYLSAGRRFLGDVGGLARQDGWQFGLGTSLAATDTLIVGAFYDRRDASLRDGRGLSEAGVFLSKVVSPAFELELSGSSGLSRGNSDYEVGVTLIWRL
jgi:hypothetical protein